MKTLFLLVALVIFAPVLMHAGDKIQIGTIVSENSVSCGSKQQGTKQTELLCQEYVVRAGATDYHIRQMKPAEKKLIPISTPIEFSLDKDKMKFHASGKSYEYIVVAETAAEALPQPSFR